jgi:hypothetical protein
MNTGSRSQPSGWRSRSQLFLNQEAVRRYQRAAKCSTESRHHRGGASAGGPRLCERGKVRLRIGAYASAEEDVRKVRVITVTLATGLKRTGWPHWSIYRRADRRGLRRPPLNVVALAPDDSVDSIRAEAMRPRELYYKEGRR